MKSRLLLLAFVIHLIFISCTKDISDCPKSNLRAISYFSFQPYVNNENNIYVEHVGVIDEVNKTITVQLPADAKLDSLKPYIQLSPWTTVTPISLSPVDFSSKSVEFTVLAESGKKAVYEVVLDLSYVYTKAEIYAVYLPDVLDSQEEPIRGIMPGFTNNTNLTLLVPHGTTLGNMRVELDLSAASRHSKVEVCDDGSGVNYRPFNNFDKLDLRQKAMFKVTSQSGVQVIYLLTVKEEEPKTV